MRNKEILILFFSLFLMVLDASAQDYSHRQLTTQDGLPTNHIYGVVEDQQGYIWAYTEKGISKFDGYSFKNYSTENGLPVNDIFYIEKNSDGSLWFLGIENSAGFIKNDSIHNIDLQSDQRIILKHIGKNLTYRNSAHQWIIRNDYVEKNNINLIKHSKRAIFVELKSENVIFTYNTISGELIEYHDDEVISVIQTDNLNPPTFTGANAQFLDVEHPFYLINGKSGILTIDQKSKRQSLTKWEILFDNEITRSFVSVVNSEVFISTNQGLVIIDKNLDIKSYAFPALH